MSIFLAASFLSIFVSQPDTIGTNVSHVNAHYTLNPPFVVIETSDYHDILQCQTEGALIYDRFLNTYETFTIIEKPQLHRNFKRLTRLKCVDSDTAPTTLSADYFCTFNESVPSSIRPKNMRFHDNKFLCGATTFIAFCEPGAENRINVDYSGSVFPANEVNLHSLCESRCTLLKLALGDDVRVELSTDDALETFSLRCREGYEFVGEGEQALDLVCNSRFGYWTLHIPGAQIERMLSNPVREFFCEPKRGSGEEEIKGEGESSGSGGEGDDRNGEESDGDQSGGKGGDRVSVVEALVSSLCGALGWVAPLTQRLNE